MANPSFNLQNLASNPIYDFIESISGNPDDDDYFFSSSPYEYPLLIVFTMIP